MRVIPKKTSRITEVIKSHIAENLKAYIIVSIILLIIFSFNFSSNNIISQLMCIGGIYALVRANSYIRSLIGGISTDVSSNFNISSKFLKNI